MKKKYSITIEYMRGVEEMNNFIESFDLGIEGMFIPEKLKLSTTTKPSKKLINGYIRCLKKACKKTGNEIRDIKVFNRLI